MIYLLPDHQVRGIVNGLDHIHKYGVIHGDLKGDNVLLGQHLRPKLCDFGLSKFVDGITSASKKGAGSLMWMSPELFDGDGQRTFSSDVYALAMTIVEVGFFVASRSDGTDVF